MSGKNSNLLINFYKILFYRSCYNAFSNFHDLDTIAIDIAPADDVSFIYALILKLYILLI
jgi:hypothetical protein